MNIGILGAGRVGGTLARALAGKGHEIVVGHLDPAAAARAWQGPPVRHVSLADAAAASPLVVHATPGNTALQLLTSLRVPLEGKTLLDVSNATEKLPNGMPGGLCYPTSSLAEKLQEALPGTRVVKSLNTMAYPVMVNPGQLSTPPTVFVSGNDETAKLQVVALLEQLSWRREWILDLGGLQSARATEALILMAPHVIERMGFIPFAVSIAR